MQSDIRLLAKVDELLNQMSGLGTRAVLRREFAVYGNARFERLAGLSNGHLYNLRKSRTYRTVRRAWDHTRPSRVMIGEHRRPNPRGQPGFVRVDTVHQGDLDGVKGVYHINYKTGRGRNTGFPVPPAQIRTCTLMHPAPALASDGKT